MTFPDILLTILACRTSLPGVGPLESATLETGISVSVPQHISRGGVILARVRVLKRDRPYMSTTARAPIWVAKLGRKVVDSTYLGGKIRMYDGK